MDCFYLFLSQYGTHFFSYTDIMYTMKMEAFFSSHFRCFHQLCLHCNTGEEEKFTLYKRTM